MSGGKPAWVELLRHDLQQLPQDYSSGHERLDEYRRLFHHELARALEPLLNAEILARPQQSYDDKRQLASWINRQTRELGLRTVCPKTGEPATLAASYRDDEEKSSRFRFHVERDGHQQKTIVHELSGVRLCVSEVRREGASELFDQSRERKGRMK